MVWERDANQCYSVFARQISTRALVYFMHNSDLAQRIRDYKEHPERLSIETCMILLVLVLRAAAQTVHSRPALHSWT